MLDDDFCIYLEYQLCDAFKKFDDEELRRYWCDGILLPSSEIEISRKYITDKREIKMQAFIGEDGQEIYELNLVFGKKALSRYARNLDIRECVPKEFDKKDLDIVEKTLTIYLS